MKKFRSSLDFGKDVFTFQYASRVTQILLVCKGKLENASLTDESTIDEASNWDGEELDDKRDDAEDSSTEELCLTLTENDEGSVEKCEEESINSAMRHWQKRETASIRSVLLDGGLDAA